MKKTNKFFVKKIDEEKNKITVEEEKKYRNPFILFLINNGKLVFTISLLLSISVFVIAITLIFSNMKDSSIIKYESNGVIVSFDGDDNSIINGTPITSEYADKVFDSNLTDNSHLKGVVIELKRSTIKNGVIIFYSDRTAIIRYDNNSFKRIYPVNGKYGIDEDGVINSKAITKDLTGNYKKNEKLNIELIYLSDGSVIVIKDNINFFVRNSDITSEDELFFTNLSGVSVPVDKNGDKYIYSDGTIKEKDYIIVDNVKYVKVDEKVTKDNIKIIYYDNGYAEVIYEDISIMVKNSDHIVYNDNIFEIIDNNVDKEIINIKDIMDIKNISLTNKNDEKVYYMIVLEETDDYKKHNVSRRLANEYINYNVFVNGNTIENKVLDNKIDSISDNRNSYLIYEGEIERLSEVSIKIGMWISYEKITNEYMNSAFIGTMKVYIESK